MGRNYGPNPQETAIFGRLFFAIIEFIRSTAEKYAGGLQICTTFKGAYFACYIQGVSEKPDTFVLSIVFMILPAVGWDKHIKIASSMEIC